jgi:serine/threonine protein kinase
MEYTKIGSGSYGIVFSPPIRSSSAELNDDNKDDLVGKVLLTDCDSEIAQEWEASEYLQEIDPHHKYFIYPIKKVELDIEDYIKHAKKPLKTERIDSGMLTQFIMVNGGPSMRSIARQRSLSFHDIVDCILQTAECIKVLQKNDFVHQDIHLGNIVKKDGKHRLIDFGFMITSSQYYTPFNILLNEEYAISPPEYRLLQAHKQNNNNIKWEQELLAKYIGIQTEGLDDIFKNRYFIMSYNYLVRSLKAEEPCSYLEGIKSYSKADIYSLGVCLIEMLSYLDDKSVPSEFVPQLSSLIVRMLMPHPENRIDIDILIFKFTTLSNVLKVKKG